MQFLFLLAALASMLSFGLVLPASAAEPYAGNFAFERLGDHLGGRQSTVYDIFEDAFGFVWFAGDTDGVLRFDGHELMSWTEGFKDNLTRSNVSTLRLTDSGRLWAGSWGNGLQYWDRAKDRYVQFLADPSDPHALAANRVQRLMIDRSGRLWIGTTAGINLIEPEAPERLIRFAHDDPDHPLHDERIWGMVEHRDGYWFATSGGVYWLSLDLAEWRHALLDEQAADQFERGAEIRTIAVAHDRVWAGSQLGVFVWEAADERFRRIGFENQPDRPVPRINAILESRNGGIWVGGHDGLYRMDDARGIFVRQGETFNLMPDVDIRALFEDSEGNLWIGSRDQGIIHGQRRDRIFTSLSDHAPGEVSEKVARLTSAVLHDQAGRLWLGIPGGLLRRDEDGDWQQWSLDGPSTVRRIERIREDGDGQVWVATDNGLFLIDRTDRLISDTRVFEALGIGVLAITDFLVEADGSLWLGLWHYGVVRWHPGSGSIEVGLEILRDTRGDLVYQLARDPEGQIWASTRYSGIFRHDNSGWTAVPLQLNGQQHAPSFYCIHPETSERLWLCTEDGLIRHDLATEQLGLYGVENGLPANRITGILQDPRAGLWVMTPQGVAWRMPGGDRFVSYGLGDGLPGLGLQRNAVDLHASGRIVMGTSHGAVELDPRGAPRGLNAPRTVMSRLWLDGVELTRQIDPARPELDLSPDHRDLVLQIAVLDFHEPERNLARYRLRGFEAQFSELSSNRVIRYMNLPPGDYLLEVEGWSSRGVPGPEALEIPIRVAAPWWHSIWFWLLAATLTAALFWISIQLRLRALRISNERLQQLVAERTRELEAANENLRARSARDFLTGLLNRRGFTNQFSLLQRLAVRHGSALSLVLFDLDHFKRVNDSLGHDAGDAVLRHVGQVLLESLRSQDLAARWGGEEFLLALPDTDRDGTILVCEKLRERLLRSDFTFQGTEIRITATFGIVTGRGAEQPLEQWVKLADDAMYDGKRAGRDRVIAAPVNLV